MAKFDKDAQIMQKLKKVAEKRSGVSNVELPAGLSAKVRPELEGRIPVDIYDEAGDIVSVFPFEREVGRYKEFDTLKPKSSFLPDEYQGKGVSSTLYSKLEDMLNAKIIPDDYQTEAGDALHDKAGYGKKFGLSNKFLKERLSPTAYKELEQRRGAVERGLNQVLEGNVGDFDEAKEMMMDQAMRISDPDKRDTVESTIHNMLRRAAKGAEEGPVDLDSLRSQMKSVGKKVLGVAPLVSPGLALLAGTNPAEAAAEDLLPPGMEPERLGPEQGTEEYNLEMGKIPDRLKTKYADGGNIKNNDIKIYSKYDLPSDIEIDNRHIPSGEIDIEDEHNYRLNNMDDIRYAVKDGKVIGHMGIDDEGHTRAVYVDPEYRRQGISEKLHNDYVNKFKNLKSDDISTSEPEIIKLWEKLQKKYPNEISKSKSGWNWNRQIEDLPIKQLAKQRALKALPFVGPAIGASLGAYGALKSDEAHAREPDYTEAAKKAVLGIAAVADPTNIIGAADMVRDRLRMSPAEAIAEDKEDRREYVRDRLPEISDIELDDMGYAQGGAVRQTKGHKVDIENTPEYKSIQKQIDDILKKENPTIDQDMLYSKLINRQIKLNENAPVLPSLPFTEKGSSRITEKELSQQEIEDIINTHGSMSDLEKEKNKIGHGGYKKVYSTKNPNYLIKESLGNDDNIAREYLTAKKLGLIVGEEIEQPVLVSDPATNKRYQIQRKAVIDPHNEYTKDYINLADKFDNSGIHNPDIHPGNVGRIKGNLKFIDTDSKTNISKYIDKNDYKQIADRLVKKTDPKVLTKMKVLRSMAGLAPYVGPLLGAGAALYSGESPAAAISEDMLPDAMQPSETGPAKGTDEYKMESGSIPQSLRYSPEEETMIRKRRGYADGGTISSNTAESLKPILKDQQLKIDALKTIKSRKPYKPRKSKKIIP